MCLLCRSASWLFNPHHLEATWGTREYMHLLCDGMAFQSVYLHHRNSWELWAYCLCCDLVDYYLYYEGYDSNLIFDIFLFGLCQFVLFLWFVNLHEKIVNSATRSLLAQILREVTNKTSVRTATTLWQLSDNSLGRLEMYFNMGFLPCVLKRSVVYYLYCCWREVVCRMISSDSFSWYVCELSTLL